MMSVFQDKTKGLIFISLIISLVITIFIEIISYRSNKELYENNIHLLNNYKTLESQNKIVLTTFTLENKVNKFMLTGDEAFLNRKDLDEEQIRTYEKDLANFSGKDTFSLQVVELIQTLESKINLMNNLVTLYKVNGLTAVSRKVIEEKDKELTSRFISLSNKISSYNQGQIELIRQNNNDLSQKTNIWDIISTIAAIVMLLFFILLLFNNIDKRIQLESDLKAQKEKSDNEALMKEQFMANMSHEIRTPLNAIIGFVKLIEKTNMDTIQSDYISAIKFSSGNLLNIVNDILDFSKIQAGMFVIEQIPFSIRKILESVNAMFADKARDKGLKFTISIDPKIPEYVIGDPTRLTQMLVNLVGNALKFTQAGAIVISCELQQKDDHAALFCFKIKDSGIGIPKENIETIFKRFTQADAGTTRKYGGTGLGLAIVKSLADLQGGSIRVQSAEDIGTEFIVELRYLLTDEIPRDDQAGNYVPGLFSDINILLVEDNLMNQKYESIVLKEMGADVDIAVNGLEALEMIARKKYDLILMDIQMPVLDGLEATRRIRKDLEVETPVIAITANIIQGEREKCIAAGMNDYLSKPINETQLYHVITRYCRTTGPALKPSRPDAVVTHNGTHSTNISELLASSRGNMSYVKEMIEIFIEQTPAETERMEEAIRGADYPAMREVIHKMRSSVSYVGLLPALQDMLDAIEVQAFDQEGTDKIFVMFSRVKEALDIAVAELSFMMQHEFK